jgi:hypothetical protein
MTNIIIIGGKPCSLNMSDIIYSFDNICRINLNLKYKRSQDKDIFFVNNHLNNFMVKKRIDPIKLKQYPYDYVDLKILEEYHDMLNNNEYSEIIEQYESGKNTVSNNILKILGCPLQFIKAPRCGYQAILYFIQKGYKVSVAGFSFINEKNYTVGNGNKPVSSCHDTKSELKILHWLHENKYVDATLCMIEDHTLPLIKCTLKPSKDILYNLIKSFGVVILHNYYNAEIVTKIINEYNRVFDQYDGKIEILKDKEDCSNDERIFYCETYSEYIKNNFSDDELFTSIAIKYNPQLNKKTLINKVNYEEGRITNSGAGWHRDNHHCQFKTFMYLSDVNEKNGCFQWITNSSMKFIGYPSPRTKSYNTRFHDETIEKIIKTNDQCNLVEVYGEKGTVILADTTYIHRGKIIEEGERKAITQYYFT